MGNCKDFGAEGKGESRQGVKGRITKDLRGKAKEARGLKKALRATDVFGAGEEPREPICLKNEIKPHIFP